MSGQPLTLTLPTNGDPFATAAPQVVAAITALEEELERPVVPADMSMSADLSFLVAATNYRVKDLLATSYVLNESALSATTYPRSLYNTGDEGDFYVNDGAGRQIRITQNGGLVSAASGNITSTGSPAYGTSSVELRWDGADLEYEMRAGAGADAYADVRLDDVLFNDGSGNFIRMTAQAMATDYTITWPAAVPASTSVVQMSSSGTLTASPSGQISTTGTVATGALSVTGAATVSSTLGVTGAATVGSLATGGAITASGVITGLGVAAGAGGITSASNVDIVGDVTIIGELEMGSNEHVVVQGTGRYKHGDMQIVIPSSAFQPGVPHGPGANNFITPSSFYHWLDDTASFPNYYAPIMLPVGARIRSLTLTYFGGGTAGTRTIELVAVTTTTDGVSMLFTDTSTLATGIGTFSTGTVNHTMVNTSEVTLRIQLVEDDFLKRALLTYDHP